MNRKIFIICILAAAVLFTAAGCLSNTARKRRAAVEELELSSLFSEEEGYHFENIRWWMTESEIQEATDKSLTSVAGYGDKGIAVYNADGLGIRLLSRICDGATAAFDDGGLCYMISFVFTDSKYGTSTVTLKDLSAQYYEKLVETFGEPDERLTDSNKNRNAVTNYVEYYWNYTLPDGKLTQLQWAKAYAVDENNPSMISLGLICLTDQLKDE